jgi:hypothetical protein
MSANAWTETFKIEAMVATFASFWVYVAVVVGFSVVSWTTAAFGVNAVSSRNSTLPVATGIVGNREWSHESSRDHNPK